MKQKPLAPRAAPADGTAAVRESLMLCQAWMAYLLTRLGSETLRVEASELRDALEHLSCRVSRDGTAYRIELTSPTSPTPSVPEDSHD